MLEVQQSQAAPLYPETLSERDIQITPGAQAKFAELLAQTDEPGMAIRVFVSGGGCGGMAYGMTFSDERTRHDSVFRGEGFEVRVDAVTLNYLRGCQIDFRDNGLQSSFVFNNVFKSVGGSGGCSACGGSGGGGGCH